MVAASAFTLFDPRRGDKPIALAVQAAALAPPTLRMNLRRLRGRMSNADSFLTAGCSLGRLTAKSSRTSVFLWIIDLGEGMQRCTYHVETGRTTLPTFSRCWCICLANPPAMWAEFPE